MATQDTRAFYIIFTGNYKEKLNKSISTFLLYIVL